MHPAHHVLIYHHFHEGSRPTGPFGVAVIKDLVSPHSYQNLVDFVSNLDLDTRYTDYGLYSSLQVLKANTVVVPQNRPQSLPSI
jgi:hypothetical protein